MRFLNRRTLLAILGIAGLIFLAVVGGVLTFLNSPRFEEDARGYIVRQIESKTGGKATLKRFQWSIRNQKFVLEDLTLRGLEPSDTAPLAHLDSVVVGLNLRSLFKHRADLFELTINRPEIRLLVDSQGKTNLPNPPPQPETGQFDFEVSIENFKVAAGSLLVNERRLDVDFALSNVTSALTYTNATRILAAHVGYDGTLRLDGNQPIPYALSADLDYTRGTVLARQMEIKSGGSVLKLQGRIDEALTRNLLGRLEYTGNVEIPFLNHFFTAEHFGGTADVAGFMEFSDGYYFTRGNAVSKSIRFEDGSATDFRGEYSYHYPSRRLALRRVTTRAFGGTAAGSITVEKIPGPARIALDLDYTDIDAAALASNYPFDPKYRIYSRITGNVDGWFEGRFERFELGGNATFKSYPPQPSPGMVSLPLDGSSRYDATPHQIRVTDADLRFFSTAIQASGLIDEHNSDLKVAMNSTNLANAYFLYGNANGAGSFNGTLTGPIATPELNGLFTLEGHRHGEWTLQKAAGSVRLDTLAQVADLRNVVVTQGRSQITVNGTTTLDGAKVDLRLQADQVQAADVEPFVHRSFGGQISGAIHVTSLNPIRLDGDVRAANLVVDDQSIRSMQAHVQYNAPAIEIQNLTASDASATVTGDVAYNPNSEALKFSLRLSSLNLERIRSLGLPDNLTGVIQQATFSGNGTRARPEIRGQASVQNLSFHGEVFPQARLDLISTGTRLNVTLATGSNLDLSAAIDTSGAGYPFTAHAAFTRYSVEKLANFNQGTVTVSGQADLSGMLNDTARLQGKGRIDTAQIRVQQRLLQSTRPFSFDFNSDRLNLTQVLLSGEGATGESTQMEVNGTVALTQSATLNLDVKGRLELAILTAAYPLWVTTGTVNVVDGHVGGTLRNPDMRGTAHIADASLSQRGVFTSLSSLNGDIYFDENRINVSNLRGQVGGGTVNAQGTGVLQNGQLESMNIRVQTEQVRLRYPEGLRTVVNGTVILRGSWTSPLLEGSLQIQNMAYRSEFEEFLALFQAGNLDRTESDFGRLKLAVHVEGNRNITIKNQLADVEARVDLDIKGTVDNPALTGHVEASGGALSFQGTKYEITRGNIDFVDPLRIDPVVDIQAETDLRNYRVILSIAGHTDNLHLDLRSDPELGQLEIVSLIAGGKTREELAQTGAAGVPSSEQLFQGGAASIMFDLLRSRVGTGRVGLLDLSRVRLDPFIGAEGNPAARITLPIQVTKDLSITYSRDVSSDRQEIIQIEYFLSKNVSILATRDETGERGLDVRLRRRY